MQRRARARRGFTLLEMMAVIIMIGFLLTIAVPNLGLTGEATLRADVRRLGSHLEFARQRAVMTGHAHRVLVGLDEGWYQIEWFVNDAQELGSAAPPPEAAEVRGNSVIAMSPASQDQPSYRPIPSKQGDITWLDEDVHFGGIQTSEGWFEGGEFQLVFDRDGTTDAVDLFVRSGDEPGYELRVSPLIDLVRILDEEG